MVRHFGIRQRVKRVAAAMEPGLGDREWPAEVGGPVSAAPAAMEPGLGDREWGRVPLDDRHGRRHAAMEPGLGDREWRLWQDAARHSREAAMEPGLGDREWVVPETDRRRSVSPPQWSPVLETGNGPGSQLTTASLGAVPQWSPVLETGNGGSGEILSPALVASRNGARSWRPGMGRRCGSGDRP